MAEAEGRVALVWRGDAEMRAKVTAKGHRLTPIFDAFSAAGLSPEPAVFNEGQIDELRAQLLEVDAVVVWVNPVDGAGDRTQLDALLREVADAGVQVNTHPDVILKMGTKEVLHRTRELGWGSDCDLYRSAAELREGLVPRLAAGQTRVLKQLRGNGGIGVFRVALVDAQGPATDDALICTQHARFGSAERTLPLGDFLAKMEAQLQRGGGLIDQAFQARLAEGMTRCYMVRDRVAGYGHQLIKALLPQPAEGPTSEAAVPGPRTMHDADAPPFQRLRRALEDEWIPQLQELLEISTDRLPVIWDADFLLGPPDDDGHDTHVLCEINVSAVLPFPDAALPLLARSVADQIRR